MSLTSLGNDQIAQRLYRSDRVHEAVASPAELTDAHFEEFPRSGFLAINGVLTPDEIGAAKRALSFLIAGGRPDYTGISFESGIDLQSLTPDQREDYVRKIMYFVEFEPRLKAVAEHPVLLDIVRRLVGTDVTMIQDMALLKPAKVGREKPWHQDTAYFNLEPLELILGTWMALDEATAENGCMHVIPGTHLAGPRPHYHDRDCQLPDEEVDVERDVVVPLKPGGVLFFSGLLHHGTPPNFSSQRRRALQYHYASTTCRRVDVAAHEQHFHDAEGYAGCAGWMAGKKARPVSERSP